MLLLKQSSVPAINRLSLEIHLIQMKRLLLNNSISNEDFNFVLWDHTFNELHNRIRIYCENMTVYKDIEDYICDLLSQLVGLSSGQPININLSNDGISK